MASKKEDKMFISLKVGLEKAASYCEDMAELYLNNGRCPAHFPTVSGDITVPIYLLQLCRRGIIVRG